MKYLRLLFSTGSQRRLTGVLAHAVKLAAAGVAAWVVYYTTLSTSDLFSMTIKFLSVMLALLFVLYGATANADPRRPSALDLALAVAALAAGVYFAVNSEAIINRISLLDPLSAYDVLFGTILFLLTIEATRRTIGMSMTLVVLVFVAYNMAGHLLPGPLGHGGITYQHFLDLMVFTTDGIFGIALKVAATYVFLFVLFGTFLTRCGGADFFFNFSAALTGRKVGGPAKVAVLSSGLYGTISGSPTSDVVVTGSVTIPMMKRLGFSSALAGGIEITASTAGGLLPPVMGSAAFIMAEYTGIAYRDIAIAATIPCLLYLLGVYVQVHLRSLRLGLMGMDEKDIPRLGPTLRQGMPFYVPLVVLVVTLLMGYSPSYVAIYATASVIALSFLSKKTRLGTNLFLALLLGGAFTVLLGMGMPTPSVYLLCAVLIGPMLVNMGIPVMAAHMFILYYACLSAITPPVAVAAFAASAIAHANPLGIALAACRLSIVTFVVPFVFIYSSGILLLGSWSDILLDTVAVTVGAVLLSMAVEGYYKGPIAWWGRLLLAAAACCFFVPRLSAWALPAGIVLVALAFFFAAGLRSAAATRARTAKE